MKISFADLEEHPTKYVSQIIKKIAGIQKHQYQKNSEELIKSTLEEGETKLLN